jgi:diguanylate cyclase (GGDEF)-like protein
VLETAESAATERAARLWRFLAVTIVVWSYYSFYYCFRGYSEAALICFAESVICCTFLARFRKLKQHYYLLTHGSLILSATGLFTLSICRGLHLADTIYFIPCCIIIAAQLLGVWSALIWCLASIGITFVHFAWLGGVGGMSADQLVNAIGFSATVFFLCQQAEHFHEKRTRSLLDLGNRLQQQSRCMEELANTDPLTGLHNRLRLVQLLKKYSRETRRWGRRLGVMVIDLVGFKEINDALGHAAGDEVLQQVAARLLHCGDRRISVSRLGGDEFCILVPGVESPDAALQLADEILETLRRPLTVEEAEYVIDASIGICIFPDQADDPDLLISFADTAMYHARSNGLARMVYEPTMTDEILYRRAMQDKLARAIEGNEFRLVFQPQFDLASSQVHGVEALLRWRHEGRDIPPMEFIPLLESSGQIANVSRWIVEQCCRQICEWNQAGHNVRISINLSAVEFHDTGFVDSVTKSVRDFQVDAAQLEFEITESLLIEDVAATIERLSCLKQLGASISLDDFGTGYSSLSYLKQFPIDRLKIDRAFVKDYPEGDDGLLASSIIVLGQALDMRVIAEGVETLEQLQFLREQGCDEIQGYLLSPPVPAEECVRFFGKSGHHLPV